MVSGQPRSAANKARRARRDKSVGNYVNANQKAGGDGLEAVLEAGN